VRQLALVAKERAGAQIAVLQRCTVHVLLALAGHLISNTFRLAAMVPYGARVVIIALGLVRQILTTPGFRTNVVRAGVLIIAIHRIAYADAGHAVIRDRTGIAVLALAIVEGRVLTTRFTGAGVGGTLVAIVAQVHVVPAHLGRLVRVAIAVIIQPVAYLRSRYARVAIQ